VERPADFDAATEQLGWAGQDSNLQPEHASWDATVFCRERSPEVAAANLLAALKLVAVRIRLRNNESTT
jgi:hypothetical protein